MKNFKDYLAESALSEVEKHVHNLAHPNKAVRKKALNALKKHNLELQKIIKRVTGAFKK